MTTTVSISFISICAGAGHVNFDVSVNGGAARPFSFEISRLREEITWEDAREIVDLLLRLHFRNKTKQEIAAEFQQGAVQLVI